MEMETQTNPLEGVKMERVHVFDGLITAPLGAVIIYKLTADSSLLQDFYIVTFNDGNTEVTWGCGTTPLDAVEKAAEEHDNLLSSTPEGANNPFREVMMIFKDMEGE